MRPILFTIPQLPASWLTAAWLLLGVGAAAWIAFNVRTARQNGSTPDVVSPLVAALVGGVLALLWSRFSVPLHSYGLFLILGFFIGVYLAIKEAQRRGLDPNIILDLSLPLLLVTVLMCRLLYVALNHRQFNSFADVLRIWSGGLSFHGALVGAILVLAWFAHTRRVSLLKLGDVVAPGVFLGYAVGRLGCFFNGCCYGESCALPWAVKFHVEGGLPSEFTDPRHPAQLYSSILALGCFFLMQRAKNALIFNRFPGQLMLLFFGLYAVERGIVEVFRRGATARTVLGTSWLTEAQLTSVIGLIVVAIVWGVLAKRAALHRQSSMPNRQSHVPAA